MTYSFEPATANELTDPQPKDYGPQADNTVPFSAEEPEKEKKSKKLFDKLGNNDRKQRGGPRALNDKDKEKLSMVYTSAAILVSPIRPKLAQALTLNADDCADAWCELAETNNGVRRAILKMIEGGAWGTLIAAHLPIMFAALPEGILPFPLPNNETTETDVMTNIAEFIKDQNENGE